MKNKTEHPIWEYMSREAGKRLKKECLVGAQRTIEIQKEEEQERRRETIMHHLRMGRGM